jgi:hypothetical protein
MSGVLARLASPIEQEMNRSAPSRPGIHASRVFHAATLFARVELISSHGPISRYLIGRMRFRLKLSTAKSLSLISMPFTVTTFGLHFPALIDRQTQFQVIASPKTCLTWSVGPCTWALLTRLSTPRRDIEGPTWSLVFSTTNCAISRHMLHLGIAFLPIPLAIYAALLVILPPGHCRCWFHEIPGPLIGRAQSIETFQYIPPFNR